MVTTHVSGPPMSAPSTSTPSWIAVRTELDNQLCFIATPYSKPGRNNTEIVAIEGAVEQAANKQGLRADRADWKLSHENAMGRVQDLIRKAEIVVAVLPDPNPNVIYEIGFAHALGKRILILSRRSVELPFDIHGYAGRQYDDRSLADEDGLRSTISEGIREVLARPASRQIEIITDADYTSATRPVGTPSRLFSNMLGFCLTISRRSGTQSSIRSG